LLKHMMADSKHFEIPKASVRKIMKLNDEVSNVSGVRLPRLRWFPCIGFLGIFRDMILSLDTDDNYFLRMRSPSPQKPLNFSLPISRKFANRLP